MKNSRNDLKAMRAARSGAVGYTTVANAMPASRNVAPYLGLTHVNGSYTQDDVAHRIAASKGCQFGVEEIKRVWNAVGNYILDRLPEELCAFDLGFARVRPAIGGSFPTMDAAFDAERNRVYVAVTPSDTIRDAVADSSPIREGETDVMPEIGNVTWDDIASQTVKSGEPFKIYGSALTLNVGDESAELQLPGSAGTVEVTVSPVAEDNWQRLNGSLAHAVEACEGATLWIWTHGFDPTAALHKVPSSKLTVLAGDTPPTPTGPNITGLNSDGQAEGVVKLNGANLNIRGTGFADGGVVTIKDSNDDNMVMALEASWDPVTQQLQLYIDTEATPAAGPGTVIVATSEGEATHACTFAS